MKRILLAMAFSLAQSSAAGQTDTKPLETLELAEICAGQVAIDQRVITFPDTAEKPNFQVRISQPLDSGRFSAAIDVFRMLSSCDALSGCNEAAFSLAVHITLSAISAIPSLDSAPSK